MTTAHSQLGEATLIPAQPIHNSRRPKFILNPLRWLRRRARLEREAQDEAQHLRRRHGDGALHAARQTLLRPDLTDWGRKVVKRTIRLLQRQA